MSKFYQIVNLKSDKRLLYKGFGDYECVDTKNGVLVGTIFESEEQVMFTIKKVLGDGFRWYPGGDHAVYEFSHRFIASPEEFKPLPKKFVTPLSEEDDIFLNLNQTFPPMPFRGVVAEQLHHYETLLRPRRIRET